MRIGFDLTSGAVLQELSLPEDTTLLLAPNLMFVPNRGEIRSEFVDDVISHAEMTLMVSSEDIERMAQAGVSGVPSNNEFLPNLLVEATFELNIPSLGEHVEKFSNVDEPLDLLFIRDDVYPVLLNLGYYNATGFSQDVASVEAPVELTDEIK